MSHFIFNRLNCSKLRSKLPSKLTFSLLVLLAAASSSAWADCPNLAGDYSCQETGGVPSDSQVRQHPVDGGISYTITGNKTSTEFIVDGVVRPYPKGQGIDGSYSGTCGVNVLSIGVSGKVLNSAGNPYGDIAMTLRIDRPDRQMKIQVNGQVVVSSKTYPIQNTIVCTLK